jgi:hypothetical protein
MASISVNFALEALELVVWLVYAVMVRNFLV